VTSEQHSKDLSYSRDQVLERGQLARAAVPYLNYLQDTLSKKYYQEWTAALPEHTKAMQFLKSKQIVLVEIISNANSDMEQAERLYAEIQEENSPERKKNEALDKQGFMDRNDQGGAS
jgi:hypothetical protein